MKPWVLVALCVSIVYLLGCSYQKASVVHARQVALCKQSCQARFDVCQKACYRDCGDCQKTADGRMVRHYGHYVHEQYVQGGIISRELKSYRDPLQCRKATCNCWADLNVCAQSCTGVIHKRLQVASACC